jgi:hypothetical protein
MEVVVSLSRLTRITPLQAKIARHKGRLTRDDPGPASHSRRSPAVDSFAHSHAGSLRFPLDITTAVG